MNAIKRFESLKKLVEKKRKLASNYRKKAWVYENSEIEKPIHAYIKWAREYDTQARNIENSGAYKYCKKIAKGRKAGR